MPRPVQQDLWSVMQATLALLRPHYWMKNLLLFVPVFLAHGIDDMNALIYCAFGVALVSMCASATYIFNDVRDLEHDVLHGHKKSRPLPSERVTVRFALVLAVCLLVLSLALAYAMNYDFALLLASYALAGALYTFAVKKLMLLDAVWLSGLHCFRLMMGGAIAAVPLTDWLLAFSLFFFFSLALAKRYCEVGLAGLDPLLGRSYRAEDRPLLLSFGAGAAVTSILVLVLYVTDSGFASRLYSDPRMLWIAILSIAAWLLHIWGHAHRTTLTTDPVSFSLRDPFSLALLVVLLASVVIAR